MGRARLEQTKHGLAPVTPGWYVANLAELAWATAKGNGTWTTFDPEGHRSTALGFGVHILWPGDSPGFYHTESNQEGFLVLSGECLAVIEGEEHRLRPWDYFHCPPGTAHITVGTGEEPCAIVMVGTRAEDQTIEYTPDAVAARHGAAVTRATGSSAEAYADAAPIVPADSPWPLD